MGNLSNLVMHPMRSSGVHRAASAPAVNVQPYVENWEADTIGINEATIEALPTHNLVATGSEVRAIDYDTLPAIARTSLTKCVTVAAPETYAYSAIEFPAGYGFTPSVGKVVLFEAVTYFSGTGSQIDMYCQDATQQEGILFGFTGNESTFLDTRTGGSGTRKLNSNLNLSTNPSGICWFYIGLQYNLGNNQVYGRIIEFGASQSEDTGWVSQGIVSGPTFDSSAEWVRFICVSQSGTTARKGVAQMRICEQTVHSYGLGQLETHNYLDFIT